MAYPDFELSRGPGFNLLAQRGGSPGLSPRSATGISQAFNHLVNQSPSVSNPAAGQLASQSVSQLAIQSVSQSVTQSVDKSVNQTVTQSPSQ